MPVEIDITKYSSLWTRKGENILDFVPIVRKWVDEHGVTAKVELMVSPYSRMRGAKIVAFFDNERDALLFRMRWL